MQKVLASHIFWTVAQIERIEVLITEWKKDKKWDGADKLPAKDRRHIASQYSNLAKNAAAMGAKVTSKSAELAVRDMRSRKDPVDYNRLAELTGQIRSVMILEINDVEFYCLNPGSAKFYGSDEPLFGREVEARIPKAANDISEAGKCFATGRYTASVFHLMRAMEVAVRELGEDLGVKNVERDWGILLSEINKKIESMPKGAEKNNWSQVHANLYHVKQAWRNETMHPKATYTEEEAREVFDAMKAFSRHLASMRPAGVEEVVRDTE